MILRKGSLKVKWPYPGPKKVLLAPTLPLLASVPVPFAQTKVEYGLFTMLLGERVQGMIDAEETPKEAGRILMRQNQRPELHWFAHDPTSLGFNVADSIGILLARRAGIEEFPWNRFSTEPELIELIEAMTLQEWADVLPED